jgi:hypothetical protein
VKLQECGNAENSWGSKAGLPDTSQLGNWQRMWRNVTLDAQPVAYLGNWTIPFEGVLVFDYVSLLPVDASRIDSLHMTVMDDSTCYRIKRELTERLNSSMGKDALLWFYVSLCELQLLVTSQQVLFLASSLPPLSSPYQRKEDNDHHHDCSPSNPSRPRTSSSSSSSSTHPSVTRIDILHVCHR